MRTVKKESDLYEPMCVWFKDYLQDRYKHYNVSVYDTSQEKLDRVLNRLDIRNDAAVGLDIQIDVLGVAIHKKKSDYKLFFIEAKKTNLTLRDLGQLWAYCKLIDPAEAFLLSSEGLGTLNKVLKVLKREDLLDFGDGKRIKKMNVGLWDVLSNSPDFLTMVPKI